MSPRSVAGILGLCCLFVLGGAAAADSDGETRGIATFAGGCFWCMEPPFDKLEGVISTTSGYTGGQVANPSYKQVSGGGTGHTEAVRIVYDPSRISYSRLLEVFWRNIDPLDAGGQFCDRGDQYRSAVFYHDPEQRRLAEQSKEELAKGPVFGKYDQPIVTEITAAVEFYPAEEYHQDYYKKNPIRYRFYRKGCGRDKVLDAYWNLEK